MTLLLKAARSIWGNKKAYIACIFLIGVGILIYVAMGISINALSIARDDYYREYRLADVFAKVQAIPANEIDNLKTIDGIEDAAGRYVYESRVLIDTSDKIITLRLISVDTNITDVPLNAFLPTGGYFQNDNDIMVGNSFIVAHNLKIGDSIRIIINGSEREFNICAGVDSPEYVYVIQNGKEVLPDSEAFDIAYIQQQQIFALTNSYGLYNDVTFQLSDGYTFDDVKTALEDALNKYGLTELYPVKDQLSYNMLETEIAGMRSMTSSIPLVFVLMADFVLYLMLKRIIEQDRTQIGTLKAFGYSNTAVLFHYVAYGAIVGFLGGLIGDLLGYYSSDSMIALYQQYFKLPDAGKYADTAFLITGMILAVGGGAIGAFMGAKGILKLSPAEAMRPPAPKIVKHDFLKFFPFLQYILNSGGYMALRSVLRNKMRSFVIIIGIMFSFAMLTFMGSYDSMIDKMMISQFKDVQVYDAKVTFKAPQSYNAGIESVISIDGVTNAEGILEIPVQLKNRNKQSGIVITGLNEDSNLYKIFDSDKKINLKPTSGGLILSNGLADKLEAQKGDVIYLSSPMLYNDVKITVSDIVEQNLGQNCYMEINALGDIFNMPNTASAVVLSTEDMSYLKSYLKEAKNVSAIEDKVTTLKNYTEFMAPYTSLIIIMEIMAVLIAFAIIYNTATISLSERKREYATLRVMGFQSKEVSKIMGFEYWLLSVFGILGGIPLAIALKLSLASMMESDLYTFPTYTPLSAFIIGVIGCIAAVFISNKASARSIRKFDMVEVLKERE